MDDVFGPGGALAHALPGYEPRREQAALAACVEQALETGEHLVAEAGTGVGKSLAYLVPALESGRRVVVATATKALQEQLLSKDVPIAAAAIGRDVRVEVLKGRANYLCRQQLQGFQPFLLADGRDAARLGGDAGLARRDRDRRPRRAACSSRPTRFWAELAVGPDRCAGRALPVRLDVLRRGRARAGRVGRPRDRQPRALLRAPRRRRRCAARARRRDLRRGAPARGVGRLWLGGRVSRAGLRRLAADVERGLPRGAAARSRRAQIDRVERTGERLLRAVAPPAGRGGCASRPPRLALVLIDALGDLANALQGQGEDLDALSRRDARRRGRRSERVPRAGRRSTASSGPSPTRSPGRRSTSRPSCATGSGATARRRFSSPPR